MPDDQPPNPLRDEPGLLAAKMRPPLRRGLVQRPHLVRRLHEGTQYALTLLSAPAGWGKTSLLSDWHRTSGGKVAWLNLDPQDNDPNRFWTYVVAAVRMVHPKVGERALLALASGSHALIEGVLPSLIDDVDVAGEPIVLVLDDYHVITEPEIHRSVEHVLMWAVRSLRLVLATRVDPPLPIGRWRAAGELVELRRPDLAFTDSEAGHLLTDGLGLDLAGEDLARLGRRTEGWAAGLYLAGLSMRHHDDRAAFIDAFTGTDRYVLDYLGAEVLARQPEEIRRFLLRTSVLSRMNAELCAVVTGRSDSAAVLAAVARTNGFLIVVDERQGWYRYHRLFGEVLRHELMIAEPDIVAELHLRAARWFESNGAVPEAIEHALAGGDADLAAALVAAHWTPYFNAGLLRTVERWLEALPAQRVTSDARLCLAGPGPCSTGAGSTRSTPGSPRPSAR